MKILTFLSSILLIALIVIFSSSTKVDIKTDYGLKALNSISNLEIKCEVMHGTPYSPPTISFVQGDTMNLSKIELKGKWEGTTAPNATQALEWFSNALDDNPFATLDWTGIILDTTWTDNGDGTFSQKNELKKQFQNSAWNPDPVTAGWMAENEVYSIELQSVVNTTATTIETFNFDPSGIVDFSNAEYKIKYEGAKSGSDITQGKSEVGLGLISTDRNFVIPGGTEFLRVNWKNADGIFYTVDFPVSIVSADDLGLNVNITPEDYPAGGFFEGGDTIDLNVVFTNNGGTELNWDEGAANGLEKFEFFFSGPKQDYEYIYEKVKVIDKFSLKDDTATNLPFLNPIKLVLPNTLPGDGTYTFLAKVKRVFSGTTEKIVLADIQVGSAVVTVIPVGNCETCHTGDNVLTKHNSVGVDQCLVCHVDGMEAAFSSLAHSEHMTSPEFTGEMTNCAMCHLNDSQDQFTSDADQVCSSCHNPVPYFPADHTDAPLYAESGLSCATSNCHSGGNMGVFQTIKTTHEGLVSKYVGGTLTALATSTPPLLDGTIDNVWSNAISVTTLKGVELKALYDNDNIYLLAQWTDGHNLKNGQADPSESVDKNLWSYGDTSWTKSGNEDRFAILWNSGDVFGASCGKMCHSDGSHKTGTGNADVWHWKSARTNQVGLSDDKWWSTAGRESDSSAISAYSDNSTGAGDAPMYSGPITNDNFIIIPEGGTTADLETNIVTSNTYPGYILNANAEGSRWDVKSAGTFDDQTGLWTVEFQRALNTGNSDDATFALNSNISFTTASFDNTGGGHASQGIDVGVYTLEIGSAVSIDETELLTNEFIRCFPNPFNTTTNIRIHLKEASHVNLSLYDIHGKEVMKLANQDMYPGDHDFTIDANNLKSGNYYCILRGNNFIARTKIMLVK